MKRGISVRRHSAVRGAYTLVELVVVISIVTAVMTLSAVLFVAMSRAERNAMRSVAAQQVLSRLNEQFRRDVHSATEATLSDDESLPALTLSRADDQSIRYQISAGGLERIATTNGAPHREEFRLPETTWKFEVSASDARRVGLLALRSADTVTRTAPELLPVQEWRMEAVLDLTPAPRKKGAAP